MKTIKINTKKKNLLLIDGVLYSLVNYEPNPFGKPNGMIYLSAPDVTQGEIQRKRRQLVERLREPEHHSKKESIEVTVPFIAKWLDEYDPKIGEFDFIHDDDYDHYYTWLSAQKEGKEGQDSGKV